MNVLKKFFTGALLGAFLLLFAVPSFAAGLTDVQAPPADVLERANEVAKRIGKLDYDFFVDRNKDNDVLRYGALSVPAEKEGGLTEIEGQEHYLVWGPWHSDPSWDGEGGTKTDRNGLPRARYLGYGAYGERVSNVFYPPDRSGNWKVLSDESYIYHPWNDKVVTDTFPQFFGAEARFDGKDDPDLIAAMRAGFLYAALGNEYKLPDINSELCQNPQDYIHVFLTPTEKTWGMGVMFHRDPDGTLWYRSVPLIMNMVYPDDGISLEPDKHVGKPGEKASFTLKANWRDLSGLRRAASGEGFDIGFCVQVSHQVNGNSYAVPFSLEGLNSQDAGDGWAEVNIPKPADSATKLANVEVTVQSVPSEVVAEIFPYLKDRLSGMVVPLDGTYLDKAAKAKVMPDLPNLVAVSLDPGISGEADPGAAYTATVTFRNDSDQPLSQVPVGAFNRQYRAVLKDVNGNEVQYADFAPHEQKTFYFTWHAPDAGTTRLTGVINADPLEQKYQETTYDDNKVFADVKVRDVDRFKPGDRRLNLQAYSYAGEDIYGEWHDSRPREIDEKTGLPSAKWCDDVHATLTVGKPTPPRGTLDWWEISWAKITYPKQNPEFSFGNPVPPDGTVTKWMDVPGRADPDVEALRATAVFEEDWALDGFGIHNMATGEDMATEPKEYPVSVSFKVTYQYSWWESEGNPPVPVRRTKVDYYTDTAEADLLVKGAGMIPYGS